MNGPDHNPGHELVDQLGRHDDPADAEAQWLRLRRDLSDRAERAGLLDVAYRTVDTPVGALLLAATEAGLVRVAFELEDFAHVLDTLAQRVSPRILNAPARLEPAARQVAEYFAGRRRRFELPLDHALSRGFRGEVQHLLPEIGYGETRSYTQLARLAGRPTAVRAVASACATNPLPVVVPCHRVLRGDGSLGGYIGGLAAKTRLLDLEQTAATFST